MSYVPVDRNITTSSIWIQGTPAQLKVWFFLMLHADPRTGTVPHSDPAIAHGCVLPLEETTAILEWLSQPDPYSRTKENDGRRIDRTEEGRVRLLNYERYRDKDHSTPRVQRLRQKRRERDETLDETVKRVSKRSGTTDKDKDKDKEGSFGGASDDAPLETPPVPPVYWDNATRDVVLDRDWLRGELQEIQREAKQVLTVAEYDQEREALRLKLLENPRQRACLLTHAGKRSSPSQFKSMATYTVGWFSRAIRMKAQRACQPARASPNSPQARRERTDAAFREVMAETLEEERNAERQKKRDGSDHREAASGLSPAAGSQR